MKTIEQKISDILKSFEKKAKTLQVYIESDVLSNPIIHESTHLNQKFHSASVGKLMTTTLMVQSIENNLLSWDQTIHGFFEKGYLDHLFVYQNQDYQDEVTITHLLSHTSGINDYFEGKSDLKPSFLDQVLQHPERFYTPDDLIDVTRKHQKAVGKPGNRFLYSDTGFILLGLILEKIHQKPFYELLRKHIFDPLSMNDTSFMFYDPLFRQSELAPVIVRNKDIKDYISLSLDFSGGGLSTTVRDLAKFMKAWRDHQLFSASSYQKMTVFHHHFTSGMYYGLGMMELRFEKVFFLLKGFPRFHGHLGVLGVHAWVDVLHGDIYIINMGNFSDMVKSFQLLIQVTSELEKARKNTRILSSTSKD